MKINNLTGSGGNYPRPVCNCETWIKHWDINKYSYGQKCAGLCRGVEKKFLIMNYWVDMFIMLMIVMDRIILYHYAKNAIILRILFLK